MKLKSLAKFFGDKLSSGFWTEQHGHITITFQMLNNILIDWIQRCRLALSANCTSRKSFKLFLALHCF